MRSDVARDLSNSAHDFVRVVWPAIKDKVRGGRIVPVEAVASQTLIRDFDVLAGIDAWQMADDLGGMRGIASRIQWGDKSWHTFTIRYERPNGARTEYEKRLAALDHPEDGWLLPHLTVHAYLTKPPRRGDLIQVGIIRTADLYAHARTHPCKTPKPNPADGVVFHHWDWYALRAAGYQVGIINGPGVLTGEAA